MTFIGTAAGVLRHDLGMTKPCWRACLLLLLGFPGVAIHACGAPASLGSIAPLAGPARLALQPDAALAGPMPLASCPPPTPTPSPGLSAPWPGCGTAILIGRVFDPAGNPADGALVRATSLDPTVPYTAMTRSQQGRWVINNLPSGAHVEIVASGTNWATARHVVSVTCRPDHAMVLDLYAEPTYPSLDEGSTPTASPSPR